MKKLLLLICIHLLINSYGQTKKSEELLEKGKELFLAQDYQQAINLINEAIKLSPKWSKAYNGRGAIYSELEKYDLALLDLNKSIELEPNEKAFFNRGLVYENLLNTDAALKDFAKAVELNPNLAQAFYNIALLQFGLKDFNAANLAIIKAIAIKQEPSYLELEREIKNQMKNRAKDKTSIASTNSSEPATNDYKKIEKTTEDNTKENEKTVTLTVGGQGATQDEARQKALRSAIEQAFGAFISSKTEILNDNLVKDEIVSVTNGNIQKYEVLSEVKIPDGGYATTLKAIVSVSKLTSFCESKGVEVEFKGAAFAMNIKLQKLNEEAEYNAILNLCKVSNEFLSKSIDFSLNVSEPRAKGSSNGTLSTDMFLINFEVNCKANENYNAFEQNFWQTVSGVKMGEDDVSNYKKINKPIYYIIKYSGQIPKYEDSIPLRNLKSIVSLKNLFFKSNNYLLNFRIISELDTLFVRRCCLGWNPNTSNLNENGAIEDEKWSLNFQNGYPATAIIQWRCFVQNRQRGYYGLPFEECKTSSGLSYGSFINFSDHNHNELNQIFSDNNIIDNHEPYTNFYFIGEYKKSEEHIFVFKIPNQYSFIQKYNHVLPLNKLEKISKYYIQPWVNNY